MWHNLRSAISWRAAHPEEECAAVDCCEVEAAGADVPEAYQGTRPTDWSQSILFHRTEIQSWSTSPPVSPCGGHCHAGQA